MSVVCLGGPPGAGALPVELSVLEPMTLDREDDVKDGKQVTEILEAFDLTGSFRAAGELAGCSPNTVASWVAKRDRGELGSLGGPVRRDRKIDEFLPKIEEWVDRSQGRIRADVCHEKLVAQGYGGSDRTVRRAVAEVKASFRAGRRRVTRCSRLLTLTMNASHASTTSAQHR